MSDMSDIFDFGLKATAPQVASATYPHTKYADELFGIAVPADRREMARFPVRSPGPRTPATLPYVFRKEAIKVAQMWIKGVSQNLLITGATGSGKTTFVEQLTARLGWEIELIACSGSTTLDPLIGQMRTKGQWEDGPVIAAMRRGAMLLLDNLHMMPDSTAVGLHPILDGRPYLISETGETIQPHPDFRIAATGNAIADFIVERFTLGFEAQRLSGEEEIRQLASVAPKLDPKVSTAIVQVAAAVRHLNKDGETVKAQLSMRVLTAWADMVQRVATGLKDQVNALGPALDMVYLYRIEQEDRHTIVKTINAVVARLSR